MNKSVIKINHNNYTSIFDFLIGLEELLLNGNDSFYTLIITGNTDPLLSTYLSNDWYNNLIEIDHLATRMRKRLSIQINTRFPKKFENFEIKDLFHIISVGINYYISNNVFHNDIELTNISKTIKKLENWDSKNPMKTMIVLDIDKNITNSRKEEIHKSLKDTFIQVTFIEDDVFKIHQLPINDIKKLLSSF